VITFNEPQRDLIEDLIEKRRSKVQEFDRLFAMASSSDKNLDDRPFVKNIENVQGDERDVIIFSVAYAKDKEGKFRVLFGSLNQEGGENRLNVAVTRARESVMMVTSFDPPDLPVEETKNLGPKRLKEYLTYAKAVSEMRKEEVAALLRKLDAIAIGPVVPSPTIDLGASLENQVKDALVSQGFKVEERVGFSGYKIDLAVIDPNDESRYALGIECDGATFHDARSARERDVVRQRFLEDRGWTIERVWSRNWWRNRTGELDRLAARINAVSEQNRKRAAKSPMETRSAPAPVERKAPATQAKPAEEMVDRTPADVPNVLPYAALAPPAKDDKSMRFIFFRQLDSGQTQLDVKAAESVMAWADEAEMRFWWRDYRGLTTVTPYFKHKGEAQWFFSMRADGAIDMHFQHLRAPFDSQLKRLELLRRLNAIPGLNIPEDYIDRSRTIMMERLRGDEALDVFIKTLRWFIEAVKKP